MTIENRDRATPNQLADEIVRLLGDADSSTAQTALGITRLLLLHRDEAEIEFHRHCVTDSDG